MIGLQQGYGRALVVIKFEFSLLTMIGVGCASFNQYPESPLFTNTDFLFRSVNTVQLHYWPTGTITKALRYPATRILSYPNKNVTMSVNPPLFYATFSEPDIETYLGFPLQFIM